MIELLSREIERWVQQESECCGNNNISEGNKDNLVKLDGVTSYLHSLVEFLQCSNGDPADFVELFRQFSNDHVINSVDGHRDFVLIGVVCLKLFLQENWTGPLVDIDKLGLLSEIVLSKDFHEKSIEVLEANGDELYQLIKYPVLLMIAYMILVECSEKFNLCMTLPLWSVKCLNVYCHVVDEMKETHLEMFQKIVNKVEQEEKGIRQFPSNIRTEFYLCCFHMYLKGYNYNKAKDCLDHAKTLLSIEVSLTAALGKRTKFQLTDLAQLRLDVKMGENREKSEGKKGETKDLPTDVTLDNDTLLSHIKFVDGESIKNLDLSPIDQACILCCCVYLQKTSPRDKLSFEELLPFLDTVLMSPLSWSIQLKALFLRCITEMSNSRKIERALNQLEAIVNTFQKPTPMIEEREPYAQAVDLNPQWLNERTHAQVAFVYGMVDTALEIFLRLHLWDDVIQCYQRLGQHGKAESVIREQLKCRESATLWCLLGDVTLDKEHYIKAWEFSKHRSSRAQRSIGQWHLRRQEFKEAVPYFEKSLELNCLQPGIAFSLGCSCMAIKEIQSAAKAFQSCVSLDPENHEAWSNLASNYIRLNQMQKAYKALLEATRLSYDNWKIWENFLLVATDIGAFEDSIRCCHRLVDLSRKTIDVEVLHILTKATIDDIPDHHGMKASNLRAKMYKLFGHITSQITSDPHIWEIYAKLCLSDDDAVRKEQGLDFLYKSHRCYTQNTIWEKNEAEVKHVMRVTLRMMEVTKDICEHSEAKEKKLTISYTTRMAISNLVIRLKKAYCDNDGNPLPSVESQILELEENVKNMQLLIDTFQ